MPKFDVNTLVQYSYTFNDKSAEITYQSCDNIRFCIHTIHLKAHTGILAPPEGASLQEIVHLTESASVLDIMFRFIYPVVQPVLALEIDFDGLKELAEAAEKYQVFPAMYACHAEMQAYLPNHAAFVLGYSLKHGYANLANEAALRAIDATFPEAMRALPSEFYEPWLNYYQKWLNVRNRALNIHLQAGTVNLRRLCAPACKPLSSFTKYKDNFAFQDARWHSAVKADVEAIPKISDFVGLSTVQDFEAEPVGGQEVILQSCDGMQYTANIDILRASSNGFDDSQNTKIFLPEASSTVALLTRYLKPARLPNLEVLPFDELRNLAFAAEKYSIHTAMGSCRIMMKKKLHDHTKEVLQYAAKTNYIEIFDLASTIILGWNRPFPKTFRYMPPVIFGAWTRYYQNWEDINAMVLREVESRALSTVERHRMPTWEIGDTYHERCHCSKPFTETHVLPIVNTLMNGPRALLDLDKTFPSTLHCLYTGDFIEGCKEHAKKLIQDIPTLSSLMQV